MRTPLKLDVETESVDAEQDPRVSLPVDVSRVSPVVEGDMPELSSGRTGTCSIWTTGAGEPGLLFTGCQGKKSVETGGAGVFSSDNLRIASTIR
jgi:hypothetical protein